SVALNEQTTIGATVENVSDFDASMQFTATLSAGIRADQANLGGTACAVAAQTVTCPLTDLAARSSLIMTVALTGVTAGDQEVTLLATSEQAEKTLPDNQLSIRVTVASPVTANAGGGGGGGGAFGSIWLVL